MTTTFTVPCVRCKTPLNIPAKHDPEAALAIYILTQVVCRLRGLADKWNGAICADCRAKIPPDESAKIETLLDALVLAKAASQPGVEE